MLNCTGLKLYGSKTGNAELQQYIEAASTELLSQMLDIFIHSMNMYVTWSGIPSSHLSNYGQSASQHATGFLPKSIKVAAYMHIPTVYLCTTEWLIAFRNHNKSKSKYSLLNHTRYVIVFSVDTHLKCKARKDSSNKYSSEQESECEITKAHTYVFITYVFIWLFPMGEVCNTQPTSHTFL